MARVKIIRDPHPLGRIPYEARLLHRISGILGSHQLGFFQECAIKCHKGFEKVAVRVPGTISKDDLGICICRLGPEFRKKFTEEQVFPEPQWERREPFGSRKKPIHLRRKKGFRSGVPAREIVPTG